MRNIYSILSDNCALKSLCYNFLHNIVLSYKD